MSDPQDSDFVAVLLLLFFNVQTSVLEGLELKIFYSCSWAFSDHGRHVFLPNAESVAPGSLPAHREQLR